MHVDSNIALMAILTIGVGYVMVLAGLNKSMLEWRRSTRSCPSCGRAITERVCMHCVR